MRCPMISAANPFWEFSVAVYIRPGVEAECLTLQEVACINVMLLLFAAYSGARGIALSDSDIVECTALVEPLHSSVLLPLRKARRELKVLTFVSDEGDQFEQMRERIKLLELDAEQMIGERLYRFFETCLAERSASQGVDQVSCNVAKLLHLTASGPASIGDCVELLLGAAQLQSDHSSTEDSVV